MSHPVARLLIVGGGSAGWLSALYLIKMLRRDAGFAQCRICLIESSEIGRIGVGEATVPSLRDTMSLLEIPEDDWLIHCDGSFKLAIKYVNWTPDLASVFWHPFTPTIPVIRGWQLQDLWLRRRLRDQSEAFAVACYPALRLCEANRAPRRLNDPAYSGLVNYAYHLDANLFAAYLKQKAVSLGVEHLDDRVVDVALNELGDIRHVITEQHGVLSADLYIDCTGFAGLLINRALGEPFLSYSKELFCDAALTAMILPHDPIVEAVPPYTTATALGAGWSWEIPT
jgi:glycine/D-amino acid oxidase-like deaminating enzyme